MARDLGSSTGEVHRAAEAVLGFWFHELAADKRFARDDALDAVIAERFGRLRETVLRSGAVGWTDEPRLLLAALIALDQFSRNIHRGAAEAFAADPLALALSGLAVARGWDGGMDVTERQFLYMPFMHSEDRGDQARSVALFAGLGDSEPLEFARTHRDQIERFGRFPGRNAALGRESTAEERVFLENPSNSF